MSVCELGNQRFTAGQGTTKEFYESLGYEKYVALDVNTKMDAIAVDLNKPVPKEIGEFDLVTNNGTSEHLFDQKQVFENIHDLTAKEGIMLHVVPWFPWLNHGHFCYQPIIFRDLAEANDYQMEFMWFGDRWGQRYEADLTEDLFAEKNPVVLEQIVVELKTELDLFIVCALRKQRDDAFQIPMQGKYVKDIEDDTIKAAYA